MLYLYKFPVPQWYPMDGDVISAPPLFPSPRTLNRWVNLGTYRPNCWARIRWGRSSSKASTRDINAEEIPGFISKPMPYLDS